MNELPLQIDGHPTHHRAQTHAALGVRFVSFLRLEDQKKVLLFEVLLLLDDRVDCENGTACLPHGLSVRLVAVGDRPIIVGRGSDDAFEAD